MYALSLAVEINPPGTGPALSRDDVWCGLVAKARDCDSGCDVHAHAHVWGRKRSAPAHDEASFWGALGCSGWAF